MATITFDKLAYSQTLRAGGFTDQQAETSAHALDTALRDTVATKSDVMQAVSDLRHEIVELCAEVKQDVTALRAEFKHDLAEQKVELLRWMFSLLLAQTALILAVVKLL